MPDESKSLVGFFSNIPRKFLIDSIEKDFKFIGEKSAEMNKVSKNNSVSKFKWHSS